MKSPAEMVSILHTIPATLFMIFLWQIVSSLRPSLPWRVNCWFCNSNIWVKYIERNCWTCTKCEQYNGFTKDGGYNRELCTNTAQVSENPKRVKRSLPKNGLCKMCNINQELKVVQLANFVPINEKMYDEEIDCYRKKLEKAYELCDSCKIVLGKKLHRDKLSLLNFKSLQTRASDETDQETQKQNEPIKKFIDGVSKLISKILLALIAIECHKNALKHKNLSNTINNIEEIIWSLSTTMFSLLQMMMLLAFPSLAEQHIDIYKINMEIFRSFIGLDDVMQKTLSGIVCFIQIAGYFRNINNTLCTVLINLLWSILTLTTFLEDYAEVDPLIMSLIKLNTLAMCIVCKHLSNKTATRKNNTANKVENFVFTVKKPINGKVMPSKIGVHNFSDSSNENTGMNRLLSGRCFTSQSNSLCSKPKHNSTVMSTQKVLSESFHSKTSFKKKEDLSDIIERIKFLFISNPKRKISKMNPFSALSRKVTACANYFSSLNINPNKTQSKLTNSTSWVAGGYWNEKLQRREIECQASSLYNRNIFFQPSYREDQCKQSLSNQCQYSNMLNYSLNHPVSSPVFPQMQYNSHVQIPLLTQAKLLFLSYDHNTTYAEQQFTPNFAPNDMFKVRGFQHIIAGLD